MQLFKLLSLGAAFTVFALSFEAASKQESAHPASLHQLSLQDRIAQLMVVVAYGDYPREQSAEFKKFQHLVQDVHIGGIIFNNRVQNGFVKNAEPFEMAAFLNRMQRMAKTPLLAAGDFERGASMRVANTAKYPFLMAYGASRDLNAIRALGAATAREARALGVSWIFAPDADVNNNPDNPIINTRSFGEDPKAVAEAVAAFIEGAHSDPQHHVLVTAKHFPGHGDTAQDSHMALARLDASKERMESTELLPFRAAIEHGVDAIMTAHMAVPAYEPRSIPATVSKPILTGLLQDQLKFSGIIVTDAMDMQGLTAQFNPGEAAVRSLEAGADVLLIPPKPEESITAILAAIKQGRLTEERINHSAAKILAAKEKLGLFQQKLVDLDKINDTLADPELEQTAQSVANRAVTLVKDEKNLFPLSDAGNACLVVLTESRFSQRGQIVKVEAKRRAPKMRSYIVDPTLPDPALTAIGNELSSCKQIYAAAFVTVAEYRGNVALAGGLPGFLNTAIQSPIPVALISLGNPYLLRNFPQVASYVATFSTTVTSEIAVVKAMFGEIPISGRMPISIPGLAKVGDGLERPARAK